MSWDELVKVALIGTDRSNLSETTKEELTALGVDTSKEPSLTILEGAALLSLMQKTGGFPKPWTKPIPEKSIEEKGLQCSKKSRNHLKLILKGTYTELLPEFVAHLAENNKLLPLDFLPDLLDQSLKDKALWEVLNRAIGNRGHWLIQQNQEWQSLVFQPDPSIWETGTKEQRLQLLQFMRQQKPDEVIPLIASTWEQDDLPSKLQFVQTLERNPGIADEYFLEKCLDNSRKEIRTLAAKILSGIPESRLCQRVFGQLTALMEYEPATLLKKEKLIIKLPEELTDELIRDGIDASSRWLEGGLKASQLGQMVTIVPPHFWEHHFEKSAGEILQLFVRSEWSELILQAITESCILHKNMTWAENILSYWQEHFQKERWQYFKPDGLFKVIGEEVFNKVALSQIDKKNSLAEEDAPLSLLLSNVNLPWQDKLSIAFVNAMQRWIAGESAHFWNGWHLRPILKKAAMYTNPDLFDQLAKGWSSNSYAWNSWEKEVDSFLSVLKFRKDMIQELRVSNEVKLVK